MGVKKLEKTVKSNNLMRGVVEEENDLISGIFRILSYNINGLNNKCLYPEFFSYIGSFEMFALLETHIMENQTERWSKYFNDFDPFWQAAKRVNHYGRASGGILCGIKKNLLKRGVKHEYMTENGFIVVKIESLHMKFTYIPIYIRGENWNTEFGLLKDTFLGIEETSIIIAGDTNARIGMQQQQLEDIWRQNFRRVWRQGDLRIQF